MRPKRVMKVLAALSIVGVLAAAGCTVAPTGPSGPAVGVCFAQPGVPGANDPGNDLLYTAYNTLNNLSLRESRDGSCTGDQRGTGTAVIAWDEPSALAICQTLDPTYIEAFPPPSGALNPDPGQFFFVCLT